ncbi:MAG TPA: adenylyl-sulfate kinase [Candidatus Polarisedimenticolia bacterium]|nr:adenylyl-sulfate kinase [Candidatus Polarisedimenticolia bacterium]
MNAAPGLIVWITGPPASGKTTLARLLVGRLRAEGAACLWLDSDDLRGVLTPAPAYSDAERDWFYGVVAHVARLGALGGAAVVISATGSRAAYRERLRGQVARFVEVALRCDPETLRSRDPKGLYAAADAGRITGLPGHGAPYEESGAAEILLDASHAPPEELLEKVLASPWIRTPASRGPGSA